MILARRLMTGKGLKMIAKVSMMERYAAGFASSKAQRRSLVKTQGNTVQWNLKSLDDHSCQVDLMLVLNNPSFNLPWFKLTAAQASSIILVDGGANLFHSLQQSIPKQFMTKVKAIVGDMDSIDPEIQQFYRQKKVKFVQDPDQEKNDFEKALAHGIKLGCKNIVVSGAFGGRLDHTFGTMSLSEKMLKTHPQINMILSNGPSIYCPLRAGFKHKITISNQISRVGCGLITFQKIASVQTSGFKWNLSHKDMHKGIEWGKFLSTSNQITSDQIMVESSKEDKGFINFVANFKQGHQ